MTARFSKLGAVLYGAESVFGEVSSTVSTRLLPVGEVDVSGLTREMINYDPVVQYPHDGVQDVRGPDGGNFSLRFPLTGHGSAPTGALTVTDLATLMSYHIGTLHSSNDGGTFTGGTASAPTVSGMTLANHSLIRMGVDGDGRGEAHWLAVSAEAGGNVSTLVAAEAAPSNGDVAYVALQLHSDEGSFEDVTGLRFRLMTGNEQWLCNGCYPTSLSFDQLNAGQIPMVTMGYRAARTSVVNATFPDTTSHAAKQPAIVGGGHFTLQAHGTNTRTKYNLREFSMNIDYQSVPLEGTGGQTEHQICTGARRLGMKTTLTTTFDAETSGTTTFLDIWNTAEASRTFYHALYELSIGGSGNAVAFYFQRMKMTGARPINVNVNGLNRVRVTWECLTNSVTTTDRSLAPWLLAMG